MEWGEFRGQGFSGNEDVRGDRGRRKGGRGEGGGAGDGEGVFVEPTRTHSVLASTVCGKTPEHVLLCT